MKKYLLIILILLPFSLYAQDISLERQKYYLSDNNMEIDTICNLVYQVRNVSSTSQVVMFTEDDVNSMPLKTLIKRKLIRRYGDFSISFFLWDGNVENNSKYVHVPEYFIKIMPPNESLNITLTLQNEDDCLVDSLFRNHILICNLEDIEGDERFCGFENVMNFHHLLYPYSSVTLLWSHIVRWLQRQSPPFHKDIPELKKTTISSDSSDDL